MNPSTTANHDPAAKGRMLLPVAYSETVVPALHLARSSRLARRIGKLLFVFLIVALVTVIVSPWQQSVRGTGDVTAYAPLERQQPIESPIKGRITRLGEGIFENAHVVKGQMIAEISDIDTEYLGRLEAQLTASQQQVEAARGQQTASANNLKAAETVIGAIEDQLAAYRNVKDQVVAAADAEVESAKHKVDAEEQQLAEQEAAFAQVKADYERQRTLYEEEIASQLKFQEAERKYKEAEAKVAKAQAYVRAAEKDYEAKRSDRQAKEQKAQVDIDYATAAVRKASGDVAKAESDLAKANAELNKAQMYLLETETKVARQRSQIIVAPFDGFITRITPNQSTQMLKEGDPICTIVPDTSDRAVQIWLDGNDAPLVSPGRHVRLQFEGWPAVQFAGWPSVAVGTFGGTVVSVDATDDGKGKFRALVLPDETSPDWPSQRYLRQGVRANGWVLLDQVPLWYEVWRQMNGFPPVVAPDEPKDKTKPPKLPKP
ncbi:MAG: toxin secretion protein [Pirellulaceae bacterium]|nr:toxin secretion protein [Planctomycetales bacterium]